MSVCLILSLQNIWVNGGTPPQLFQFGTGWRWVVSSDPALLCEGNDHHVTVTWEPGWICGPVTIREVKNYQLLVPGIEPCFLCHPARNIVTIPTELSRRRMYSYINSL